MSADCTMLYINAVFYDVFEDEIFEYPIKVNSLDMSFYNEDFPHTNDIKKISFKGKIENNTQGSILLGCV